eukprot:TRINITY_DN35558_c0_g1_i1.p1 TRINITY_DN35558_c0_g1~~TRINITY_DN35558_c0_g1_i1.p1  ORF type:complete len:568 (-),score=185.16 TRINITY_DN35558_c0_g1_i1:54-1757(-)
MRLLDRLSRGRSSSSRRDSAAQQAQHVSAAGSGWPSPDVLERPEAAAGPAAPAPSASAPSAAAQSSSALVAGADPGASTGSAAANPITSWTRPSAAEETRREEARAQQELRRIQEACQAAERSLLLQMAEADDMAHRAEEEAAGAAELAEAVSAEQQLLSKLEGTRRETWAREMWAAQVEVTLQERLQRLQEERDSERLEVRSLEADVERAQAQSLEERDAKRRERWKEVNEFGERVERLHLEERLQLQELQAASEGHEEQLRRLEELQGQEEKSTEEADELAAAARELAARSEAREDAYWDDAPFLEASAEQLQDLERQVAELRASEVELRAELQKVQGAQQRARAPPPAPIGLPPSPLASGHASKATSPACPGDSVPSGLRQGEKSPATKSKQDAESALSPLPAPPSSGLLTQPPTPAAGGEGGVSSPVASPSPPSPQCKSAGRAALEAENERLRERIVELQAVASRLQAAAAVEPGLCCVQGAGAAAEETHNPAAMPLPAACNSFESAVAATGARVLEQLKEALREDVALLRKLQIEKRDVEQEWQKERRLRAAMMRRLDAVQA